MSIRIYTTGVFDLFHKGHLAALRKAKSQGDYLLVGVISDEESRSYKRLPIIPLAQRLEIVSAIDCVDEAIECPVYLPENFYNKHRIDLHCQGDNVLDHYAIGDKLGIMRYLGRYETIDTTRIIEMILDRQ